MSEIGYDITRGGVEVKQLPALPFMSVTWSQQPNTQISTSPHTNASQTNELPGSLWKATYAYNIGVGKDFDIGKIRAFLVKLRGASGRFFAYDPSWCKRLGDYGKSESASVTVNLPELTVIGGNMFPEDDLYPADDLYPNTGDGSYTYPAYSFTLSASYSLSGDLYLQGALESGDTQCSVNSISVFSTYENSNPWDYSNGVRPEYEDALINARAELYSKLGDYSDLVIFKAGDYIRIDDALRMVVDDFNEGDSVITFEPPLIHPASSGTQVNIKNVGVIMRLVDDNQANFNVTGGQIHQSISFSAIEAL